MLSRYLPDINVLLALTNAGHIHHLRAHQWFSQISGWATTPFTEAGFVRLMLNPVVTGRKIAAPQVLAALAALRALPGHSFLSDTSSLGTPNIDLSGLRGHRQVTDLHLVNLAASAKLVLATFDSAIKTALLPQDQHLVELV
ncbi:MAG: hypothetical protein FWG47_04950 [Propionibacteriaceae bacterium]|nr:hypothetical protein [Propionibacteriaceae bacterium]